MHVLLHFDFSGRITWIWPLGLISDGSDGATVHLWLLLKIFLGETSVLNGFVWCVAISAPGSLHLGSHFEKFRFGAIQFIIFSEVLIEDSNERWDIISFVLLFYGFTVEAVDEVGESRAWVCPFGIRGYAVKDCRLGWFRDGSDGDVLLLWLTVTSSAGWVCWKGLNRSLCGDIGLIVLSGLGSRRTHFIGVEGATMARRAPFSPSSIPADIEQSMKLFVCPRRLNYGSKGLLTRILQVFIMIACVEIEWLFLAGWRLHEAPKTIDFAHQTTGLELLWSLFVLNNSIIFQSRYVI